MNKELFEIVGNGKPTGSVPRETIAVSVTISISVQNRHSRILLRALVRDRMREMRREPEVPEARVPVVECLDGLARITSKELAPNSFCEKWHPPECLFYESESGCRCGEKCSYAHRQVEERPTKWSKSNNDKSTVAMVKEGDWHERESVTDQGHDRSGSNPSPNSFMQQKERKCIENQKS